MKKFDSYRKSNDLFMLVKSLSKSEKRYFKQFTKKNIRDGKNKYGDLFDAIDAQDKYSPQALRIKEVDAYFLKNLNFNLHYLYKLVLKCLRAYHSERSSENRLSGMLMLGDNAYDDGTDQEYQDAVFNEAERFGLLMKNLPFWSTPGNHDYNSINRFDPPEQHVGPYFEIMDVPTNGEAGGLATGTELYYSFDYANTHFISLNSELLGWVPSQGFDDQNPMLIWLRQDLAANTQDWTIVYFHEPPYSKGSHDSDAFFEIFIFGMRENYVPVFDEFGVDLVLSGHSHVFERSFKIRGHYGTSDTWDASTMLIDGSSGNLAMGEPYVEERTSPIEETGTVYIVCGNSGSSEGNPEGLNHPVMYTSSGCDTCVGSIIVDIDGLRMDVKYLTSYGDIEDDFTMLKTDTTTSISFNKPSNTSLRVSPNPFSSSTKIVLNSNATSKVDLAVYNTRGQFVETIYAGILNSGANKFTWKPANADLGNGNYIIRLFDGTETQSMEITYLGGR